MEGDQRRLEQRELTCIIAARLYHPLQRMVYARQNWQEIAEGIWITEFFFQHEDWLTDRRFIAVRQDIKRRQHAMGKELSLFNNDFDVGNYRYSVWITNGDLSTIFLSCSGIKSSDRRKK